MQPESLVQLVGSGNTTKVEEEWMRLVEASDATPEGLAAYHVVLAELCRVGKMAQAEELAWAAIETFSDQRSPHDGLTVAGPFLLALGESQTLRGQVTQLYRSTFAEQAGLEELLTESGIAGGRPVRRALRTLEVGLALREGDYLVARDDDVAARVESIDRSTWRFTILDNGDVETVGAVHLADRYQPAKADDFRVMRHFAAEDLKRRLNDDPAAVVVDICRQQENKIDSDRLEAMLVPAFLKPNDWKSWWSRARTALKSCRHVKVEGRGPYIVTYVDVPVVPDEAFLLEFQAEHDPQIKRTIVDRYLRDCKARKTTPSQPALRRCYDHFHEQGKRLAAAGAHAAAPSLLTAQWIGELIGVADAADAVNTLFRNSSNMRHLFDAINDDSLFDLALTALSEGGPADWQHQLLSLLPTLPMAACDRVASRLVDSGLGPEEFEPSIQRILADPAKHFEALLWLWDGPSNEDRVSQIQLLTLLTRLLRTLDEGKRSDDVPKDAAKRVASRAKTVLAGRKYERFRRCLEGLDPGMAAALRTQIGRLESVGRNVRGELLNLLRLQFPTMEVARPEAAPWDRANVLYVTQRGLTKKHEELEHHINVKMRDNARAIGRAAELGDLSENSEYKFALEERDLLRARLAQMNAELAIAHVISPQDIPTDHVGIGTKVVLRRTTDGQHYEMVLAGPWEADPAAGWLNYQTPVAREIMGKRIGDVVEFNHSHAVGAYEIVELHNALAENDVRQESISATL